MFSGIVIPQDPTVPVSRVQIDGIEDLQALVGGMVDVVPMPSDPEAEMWINDEGKFTQEPNARATALCVQGVDLFVGDFISGTAVISGPVDGRGETTTLSSAWEFWPGRAATLAPASGQDANVRLDT